MADRRTSECGSVGVHPALIAVQVAGGMLALAIDGEPIVGGGRIRTMPGPFIADVSPDPCGLGLAIARRLQLDRHVVGEDRRTAPQGLSSRLAFGSRLPPSIRSRRPLTVGLDEIRGLAPDHLFGLLTDPTGEGDGLAAGPRGHRRSRD